MYKQNLTEAQKALWDGLIQLWQHKSIYQIGIKELCQASNVARSTFYVYYANIDELAAEIESFHIEQIVHITDEVAMVHNNTSSYSFYEQILAYLNENKQTFHAWLIAFPNQRFINRWKQEIKVHLTKRIAQGEEIANQGMLLEMTASAMIAAYTYWIENPYEVDIEKMNEVISSTLQFIE